MKIRTIKNPVPITNIGDPYVLRHEGVYYLYATSRFHGFYCWKSDNLSDWSGPRICYRATDKSFGDSCFWAPEVYEFKGKFYMYYTAQWKIYSQEQLRIGVAVSDTPEGPFLDVYNQRPMFDPGYGVLDAHILKDGERNYLYYSRAGANHIVNGAKEADIGVVELGDDFITVKGEGCCILKPEQAWERKEPENNQFWNEGPFVVKHNGYYHLMYSANYFGSIYYGIGAAVSRSPTGPFVKYGNNPILCADKQISGPGHNSVVTDSEGMLYCIYHAHTDYGMAGENRQVYITRMDFEQDRIVLHHPPLTV